MANPVPRALILDPEASGYLECIQALTLRGWIVDIAPTFDRALALLAETVYAFALIELRMPEVDGLEAWALIRKLSPNIFGIITTSSPSLRTFVNPYVPGILAFLLKPVEALLVAHLASIALELQQLYSENQRWQSKLVGMNDLTSALAASKTERAAVRAALSHLPGVVVSDIALVRLFDTELGEWSEFLFAGSVPNQQLTPARIKLFQDVMGQMQAQSQSELVTQSLLNAFESEALLKPVGLSAVLLTPILVDAEFGGVLLVAKYAQAERPLAFMEVQFCNLVARIVGMQLQTLRVTHAEDVSEVG